MIIRLAIMTILTVSKALYSGVLLSIYINLTADKITVIPVPTLIMMMVMIDIIVFGFMIIPELFGSTC